MPELLWRCPVTVSLRENRIEKEGPTEKIGGSLIISLELDATMATSRKETSAIWGDKVDR